MSGKLFPRLPFDGVWEVTGLTNVAVPNKEIAVTTRDPKNFDERAFPAGTHLRLAASDEGDDAHPEWRTVEMTFLPPLPALICQHPEADRLGCHGNHPPDKPVTWDAWLQMEPFDRSDALQPFYRQSGVRPGDFRFTIVRQDKAFAWSSVFFKDKNTLIVEVSYYPAGRPAKAARRADFEVVGMILQRVMTTR